MSETPLMPKATAVWLVDNTALSFDQIAEFCHLHTLEVQAIADGESAVAIKGVDPVLTGQLTRDEIELGEADTGYRLKLSERKTRVPQKSRKGPRYTPVSRREDRPNAILWLLRNHPELKDAQIMRLVGTTKPTIESIRSRTHWNINALQPIDPVALGLTSQIDLDFEVEKAAKATPGAAPTEAPEGITLLSAEETTTVAAAAAAEAIAAMGGGLNVATGEDSPTETDLEADAVFAKLKSLTGDGETAEAPEAAEATEAPEGGETEGDSTTGGEDQP